MIVHGPWIWNTPSGLAPHWSAPPGTSAALDLRTIEEMSRKGGVPGPGLFEIAAAPLGYTELPDRLGLVLRSLLGVTSDDLGDAIWEKLTVRSDPDGLLGPRTICPDHTGVSSLRLGSLIRERRLTPSDPEWSKTIAVMVASLPSLADPARGKVLWNYAKKLGVKGDPVKGDIQTIFGLNESPVRPSTTITESFNKADSGTLGPDLTWSELSGNYDVVGNRARSTQDDSLAQATTDLSSTDMYSQVSVHVVPASMDGGPAIRVASGTNCYMAVHRGSPHNNRALYKIVSGSYTNLGSASGSPTTGFILKVNASGSSISAIYNGSTFVGPLTDTSITGGVRAGIQGWGSQGDFDDFEAQDAGGAAPVTRRTLTLLGVGR